MNLSEQSREIINNQFDLRKALSQMFPADLVNYIVLLIVKDQSHQAFIENTKD